MGNTFFFGSATAEAVIKLCTLLRRIRFMKKICHLQANVSSEYKQKYTETPQNSILYLK